jgi:hypothetical protein
VQDVIEEEVTPNAVIIEADIGSPLVDFANDTSFDEEPLIDDPVTGAGNDDLWSSSGACDDSNAAGCDSGDRTDAAGGPGE